jgi:hypothetical protein
MVYVKAAQANVKLKDTKRVREAVKTLNKMDVNKVARAIEDDAGMRCRVCVSPWHKPRRARFRGFTRQSRLSRAAEAVP